MVTTIVIEKITHAVSAFLRGFLSLQTQNFRLESIRWHFLSLLPCYHAEKPNGFWNGPRKEPGNPWRGSDSRTIPDILVPAAPGTDKPSLKIPFLRNSESVPVASGFDLNPLVYSIYNRFPEW